MQIPARYWARLKDGRLLHVCGRHLDTVARRIDDKGRMELHRGVRCIGSMPAYTRKSCIVCQEDHAGNH
jgi:hypothetical protein